MPSKRNQNIEELLLQAHRKGVERAIDLSARTGIPLVIEENGKIKRIKPKYKYVRVPHSTKQGEDKISYRCYKIGDFLKRTSFYCSL